MKSEATTTLTSTELPESLNGKQINVMDGKVEPIKAVGRMIRAHREGIVAWARMRLTDGFLEVLNRLSQAAKSRSRGYRRMPTIRTIVFLISGTLEFRTVNPHAA